MKRILLLLTALALLLGGVGQARAEFIITFSESKGNVVATGSGTINLAGLSNGLASLFSTGVQAVNGDLILGSGGAVNVTEYVLSSAIGQFGSGGNFDASSGTGVGAGISAGANLLVPSGYTSNSLFMDSATWNNKTISQLGLKPGTYEGTWGSTSAGTFDDIKVVIPASAAPEPASLALLAIGAVGLLGYGWQQRKRAAA